MDVWMCRNEYDKYVCEVYDIQWMCVHVYLIVL